MGRHQTSNAVQSTKLRGVIVGEPRCGGSHSMRVAERDGSEESACGQRPPAAPSPELRGRTARVTGTVCRGRKRGLYICPNGKLVRTTDTVSHGGSNDVALPAARARCRSPADQDGVARDNAR